MLVLEDLYRKEVKAKAEFANAQLPIKSMPWEAHRAPLQCSGEGQREIYENPSCLLSRNGKTSTKIYIIIHGTQNSQNNLKITRQFTLFYFKTYYKSTVMRTVWYQYKDNSMGFEKAFQQIVMRQLDIHLQKKWSYIF